MIVSMIHPETEKPEQVYLRFSETHVCATPGNPTLVNHQGVFVNAEIWKAAKGQVVYASNAEWSQMPRWMSKPS